MPTYTDYPINWYSRTATDSSGVGSPYLRLLIHADRSLTSLGTVFVDKSTYNWTVTERGSAIVQTQAAAYFSSGGIFFSGSTASADNAHIVWDTSTVTTAPSGLTPFVIDNFIYFTSLTTAGMYWWEIGNPGRTNYSQARFYQATDNNWYLHATFHDNALGNYFDHEWKLNSMSTGTWYHFAIVRDGGLAAGIAGGNGGNRIGTFQNGSQLDLTSTLTGFPTTGSSADWAGCAFGLSASSSISFGGVTYVATTADWKNVHAGYMDELRFVLDTFDGAVYDPFLSEYSFNIPQAPYLPADGTFNITMQTMQLSSSDLHPSTDGLISLGNSTQQWNHLYVTGTAFVDALGENMQVLGTAKILYNSTNTYTFSSSSGYLTLVAGTQIDLQSNVGIAAKNIITDTTTGMKVATGTNQKLAFYNSTPIVQPSGSITAALASLGLVSNPTVAGLSHSVTTTSAALSLTTVHDYIVCNSGTSFAVTFPLTIASSKEYMVKNIGAGTVTLTASTADLIDGSSTFPLAQYAYAKTLDYSQSNTTYLKLYLAMDGADASTTFTDSSPVGRTVTPAGDAQIDTAQSVFGGASGLFDGTGDLLSTASAADLNIGSNAFGFRLRARLVGTTSNNMFCSRVTNSGSYFYFGLESDNLRFRDYTGVNVIDIQRTVAIASATWYEFGAFGTSAGDIILTLDGVKQGATSTGNAALTSRTTGLTIAAMTDNASYYFNGWMDEFLFFNGLCEQTATYSLATAAFATIPGKWLLIT